MDRQEIAEAELKTLVKLRQTFVSRIESCLQDIRGQRVKLYLTEKDQHRLLTLRVWETEYKVSLKYMLLTLLPFWEQFIQRKSKRMQREGLNVRVSTLVGKKSEQILRDSIQKTFPNGENISFWISERREEIISYQLTRLGRSLKHRHAFSTPSNYIKYYRRYLRQEQRLRDSIIAEMKTRNFRNNPFLEGTCR